MPILRDIALLLLVALAIAFGYFVIKRFDSFILKNRDSIEKEDQKEAPFCVMLTDDMTDEEITQEIRKFREKSPSLQVVISKRNKDNDQ